MSLQRILQKIAVLQKLAGPFTESPISKEKVTNQNISIYAKELNEKSNANKRDLLIDAYNKDQNREFAEWLANKTGTTSREDILNYLKATAGKDLISDLGAKSFELLGNQTATIPLGAGTGYAIGQMLEKNPTQSALIGAGLGLLAPTLSEVAARNLLQRKQTDVSELPEAINEKVLENYLSKQ